MAPALGSSARRDTLALTMRERIFQIVQRARPGDKVSHGYDIFIVAVAFLSIVPLMFRPQDMSPDVAVAMNMIDVVTVCILLLDYLLRWMTHDLKTGEKGWRAFARYPFTPLAIVDLLAILPSLGVLPETFKFLRVLRVTKLFRYSKNLTIVANVFRAQRNTLLSVLAVALMYIFVSGLVMFVNEPDTFDNFFDALYWATTALTTVGYGDVYPVTDLGKFISMVSSLFGIAIIALPAGIITGGFLEQIRQRDEDRDAYFHTGERKPFKGRTPFSYGSVRAYAKAHPKLVAYGVTMFACVLLNGALYFAAHAFGTPVWLDTVGTALAAILLEPAAGLLVGFANNLILAVQFGNAGNLLYYGLSAVTALVYGIVFARGKRITLRSLGWAALFLVAAESLISTGLAFSLAGGQLTTAVEQLYGSVLASWGVPGVLAVFGALLTDKLIDTAAVFVLVMGASRLVIGSRLDPARWFSGVAAPADPAPPAVPAGAPDLASRYVLGIDVGGTHTKVGAFTAEGAHVVSRVFDSPRVLADGSHVQLSREVSALLAQAGIDGRAVVGVGLAVPGAVAAEESLKLCPHLDLDLRSYKAFLLAAFPKAHVSVLNDADAAVLGDRWRGTSHDREDENVAFVTLGTGVGAGIIARGRLFSGVHGAAGEFGHLCVNPAEETRCSCGKAGCLEQYASAAGLVRHAREAYVAQRGETVDDEAALDEAVGAFPDARAVLDAAAQHDPVACAALERFSDALGYGLAQMACLVDPDVFVLGGGLSERADLFIDAVRSRYRACVLSACRDTPIVASSLGNECGVYGAAYRAFQDLDKSAPGCVAKVDAIH